MKTSARYNQLVEFWKPSLLPDGYGGTFATYQLVFADYANVIPKTEKRGLQQGQLVLVGYFDLTIRFRRDINIDKSLIIKHENEFYNIHSIVNDQDKEYALVCTTTEPIDINYHGFPYPMPVILE